jgi:hypothetical protein
VEPDTLQRRLLFHVFAIAQAHDAVFPGGGQTRHDIPVLPRKVLVDKQQLHGSVLETVTCIILNI